MSDCVFAMLAPNHLPFVIVALIFDDLHALSRLHLLAFALSPYCPSKICHGHCSCSSFCFGEAFTTCESSESERRGAS